MKFRQGDKVQWRGDHNTYTAEVIEDKGDKIKVIGLVGKRGPYIQEWFKEIEGRKVERVTE